MLNNTNDFGCRDKLIKLIYELIENNESLTGVNSFSENHDDYDIYFTNICIIAENTTIIVYIEKYYVIEKQIFDLYLLK
jgi:hypothetical protein